MGERHIVDIREEQQQQQQHNINIPSTALEGSWRNMKKPIICRVPQVLRKDNVNAYTPQLVYFGPYHRMRDVAIDQHKEQALRRFRRRTMLPEEPQPDPLNNNKVLHPFEVMLEHMGLGRDELLASYEGSPFLYYDIEKLFTESCFFLEILLLGTSYHEEEPDFNKPYIMSSIRSDMLLLENQQPLFLLHKLIQLLQNRQGIDVDELMRGKPNLAFLNPRSPFGCALHYLDAFRMSKLVKREYPLVISSRTYPAKYLSRAGVRFVRSETECFNDITFKNGFLKFPFIDIKQRSESVILNLIAFEQTTGACGNEVTCYAFFVSGLISTAKDVAVLREKGMLRSFEGNDDNTVALFNRLTKNIELDDTIAPGKGVDVNKQLEQYCNRRWQKLRAYFMENVVESAVWGGAFLLFLTIVQTLYAVLSYHHSSS